MHSLEPPIAANTPQRVIPMQSSVGLHDARFHRAHPVVSGVRANVIREARAMLNIRLLPGDTIDVLLARSQQLSTIRTVASSPAKPGSAPTLPRSPTSMAVITKVFSQDSAALPCCTLSIALGHDLPSCRLCHNVQAYLVALSRSPMKDLAACTADDERYP